MSDDKKTTPPAEGGGGNPANSTIQPCLSCSVSITPKPLKLCGATPTGGVTAAGSPGGGGFAWSSDNPEVASAGGGATATVTGNKSGTANITVTYSPAGCGPCTDTVPVTVCICTPVSGGGRLYAYARKSVANLTGAAARIKTRWGKVCCEDLPCNKAGKKNAYVNISRGGSWAQTGYRRYREDGSTTAKNMRYTEMNGSDYKRKDWPGDAPAEGSSHDYRIELDPSTGTWTFYYDGATPPASAFQDDGWKDSSGSVVNWPGEILNREDDMPGTSGDKCNFTNCQYRVGGGSFVDAGIAAANLINDDNSEFGIELVSGKAFNMWDKKPNP